MAGGLRASRRQDYGAAVSLFERAAALVPPTGRDLALEIEFEMPLIWTGRGEEALRRADALAERAAASGDRVGDLCGRIRGAVLRLESGGGPDHLEALVQEAVPVFEAAGEDLALYIAYDALASVADMRGREEATLEALERAWAHAARAGHQPPGIVGMRASLRFFGPTPVVELLAWLDENEPPAGRDHFLRAYRAGALAMLGRFDEARAILADTRAELEERGPGILLANITAFESVWVELWAGEPAAAAEFAEAGWRQHEALGEHSFMRGAAHSRARTSLALDRLDDADAWLVRAAELGATTGWVWWRIRWRSLRAELLSRRGDHAEAERLAREAATMCEETDMLDVQGDVHAGLGEVLLRAERATEAAEALKQALARFETKGNVVMAGRMRERLAALKPPTVA
jgi:tetratricopeptide (TPR) repeat protein